MLFDSAYLWCCTSSYTLAFFIFARSLSPSLLSIDFWFLFWLFGSIFHQRLSAYFLSGFGKPLEWVFEQCFFFSGDLNKIGFYVPLKIGWWWWWPKMRGQRMIKIESLSGIVTWSSFSLLPFGFATGFFSFSNFPHIYSHHHLHRVSIFVFHLIQSGNFIRCTPFVARYCIHIFDLTRLKRFLSIHRESIAHN